MILQAHAAQQEKKQYCFIKPAAPYLNLFYVY